MNDTLKTKILWRKKNSFWRKKELFFSPYSPTRDQETVTYTAGSRMQVHM